MVSRSSGLTETMLQGTVKGKKSRRSRQKKGWKDNIKEWTGMDFASSTKTIWKANSFMVSDDLPRVWDITE